MALHEYVYAAGTEALTVMARLGGAKPRRLQRMIKVARMLKRRFENIITYLRHRITNARSESLNAIPQWVTYTARGFRTRQTLIHAIYFHCGVLPCSLEQPNSRKNCG